MCNFLLEHVEKKENVTLGWIWRWLRACFLGGLEIGNLAIWLLCFPLEPNSLGIGTLVVSLIVILLNGCWSGVKVLDLMEVLFGGE